MELNWPENYLLVFTGAALISYLSGFAIRFIASKFGVMDQPTKERIHASPTPRLGGIAIFLGFGLSLFIAQEHLSAYPRTWAIIIGAFMTMLIGVIDDITARRGGVPAPIKLIVLLVITYLLSLGGIIVNFPFPYIVNLLITLIWIVGVTSAFNALDNMDGLASGYTIIASLAFVAVAVQTGQVMWGILSMALIGANLGFLGHNFYPAKLFMGDSGSFFLGFTLAVMGIKGAWSTNPFKASLIPIIILGLPLLDLAYVIIRRQLDGTTRSIKDIIAYSAQDHFSHRLKALGLTQKQTVLFIYLISFCLACGAFILRDTAKWEAVLLLVQFILTVVIIFWLISKVAKKQQV
jgi:UDP-GlcNAc:undecaprenyl-phosphate GlcNAc-1-phosphate transferase